MNSTRYTRPGLGALTLALAFALAISQVRAQDEDLMTRLGEVSLRLGMNQEDALAQLDRFYDLRRNFPGPGSWGVFPRDGFPTQFIGAVSFADGRLASVVRPWSANDRDITGHALVTALFNALQDAAGSGRTCRVWVESDRLLDRSIIQCGRRRFDIATSPSNDFIPSVIETLK